MRRRTKPTSRLNPLALEKSRQLAGKAGLRVVEKQIAAQRLAHADEVFVTGTVVEVLPIVRLDGRPVGTARPGSMTRELQQLYAAFRLDRATTNR